MTYTRPFSRTAPLRKIDPETLEARHPASHLLAHLHAPAGQEAGIHRIGALAEAQVDARRLHLIGSTIWSHGEPAGSRPAPSISLIFWHGSIPVYDRRAGRSLEMQPSAASAFFDDDLREHAAAIARAHAPARRPCAAPSRNTACARGESGRGDHGRPAAVGLLADVRIERQLAEQLARRTARAMRAPPPAPKMCSAWPQFEQMCTLMFSTMPSTGTRPSRTS